MTLALLATKTLSETKYRFLKMTLCNIGILYTVTIARIETHTLLSSVFQLAAHFYLLTIFLRATTRYCDKTVTKQIEIEKGKIY